MTNRAKPAKKPILPQGPQDGAPLAAWVYLAEDIAETGLDLERTANAEELLAVARTLNVVAVRGLRARLVVTPLHGNRFRLEGDVGAEVTQTCGITLEPVVEAVAEPFTLEYWPASDIPKDARETDLDPFAEETPEAIEDGQLKIGRIVYEYLAQGINPFPRKPGVELDVSDTGASEPRVNPFAVLAELKTPGKPPTEKQG